MNPLWHWLVPYNFILAVRSQKAKKRTEHRQAIEGTPTPVFSTITRESLVEHLVARGCMRDQVNEGSMPEESLHNMTRILAEHFGGQPIHGLHIGNFVGVSLTYLTYAMAKANPESLMVSIDPNIPHRGIRNPMGHALSLLNRAGVQKNSIILTGYSLAKSISNDGQTFEGYDPATHFSEEESGEEQLRQLASICPAHFHFVLIDGNHNGTYFAGEVEQITKLLRPGGLLIADDIQDVWFEIRDVYDRLSATKEYEEIFHDGRIGIVRKQS